jgi:hypothetical protein
MTKQNQPPEQPQGVGDAPVAPAVPTQPTPLEHGKARGLVTPARVSFGAPRDVLNGPYRAADYLHGWGEHNLRSQVPFTLSTEDFEAAIKAAASASKDGSYAPHAPALAPHLRGNS